MLILRSYKGLFFGMLFDLEESGLALLDLLQMIIDALEEIVPLHELDIAMHALKVTALLDEIILSGWVINSNKNEI